MYLLRGMLFYRNQQIIIAWWQNKKFQYYWLIILYILSNLSNSDQKLKDGHHICFSVILKFAWSTIFSQFKSIIIVMIISTWVKFNKNHVQLFLKYILLSTQIDHHLKKWCNNQYNRWMEMQITSYFQSVFDLLYLFSFNSS